MRLLSVAGEWWASQGSGFIPDLRPQKPVGQEGEGRQSRTRHCEENNVCQSRKSNSKYTAVQPAAHNPALI
jgi:hypothetical protein